MEWSGVGAWYGMVNGRTQEQGIQWNGVGQGRVWEGGKWGRLDWSGAGYGRVKGSWVG